MLATSDEVAKAVAGNSAQLIDSRSLGQYLGSWKKDYVYAAGHIKGAKHMPNELITTGGMPATFTDKNKMSRIAAAMGVSTSKPTITYCNSGHLASGAWFVLHEIMGNKNTRLYDGSMHQWTLEKRPVVSMQMN